MAKYCHSQYCDISQNRLSPFLQRLRRPMCGKSLTFRTRHSAWRGCAPAKWGAAPEYSIASGKAQLDESTILFIPRNAKRTFDKDAKYQSFIIDKGTTGKAPECWPIGFEGMNVHRMFRGPNDLFLEESFRLLLRFLHQFHVAVSFKKVEVSNKIEIRRP